MKITVLQLFLAFTLLNCQNKDQETKTAADLILTNGTIWTANEEQPFAESVAVKTDTIIAVGDHSMVEKLKGSETKVIDLNGKFVTPGFIDSHVHFLTGGFRLSSVKLRDANSPAGFIERLKTYTSDLDSGEWITGGDWDHEQWGGELPQKAWIDSITPNNPVWINRLDGHMALANSVALSMAGVDENTKDIEGGTIVRDAYGKPAGILKDNAMSLINKVVEEPSDQMKDKALNMAMEYVASKGVTSVHSMGSWSDLEVYERAQGQNRLTTRIYAAVPLATWQRLADKISSEGNGDRYLKIGALKGFVDGSLGSHTAAFIDPFSDDPENTGLLVNTREDLYEWTVNADKAGLQVVVHAIGDRANRILLDIFEKVDAENGIKDRRFRIEHAQHLQESDILRFAQLEVIPSMQPYHAIDDGRWAEKVIGPERIKTTYAFRSLLDAGATLAFGSDWFVAPPTPLEGIYAAVSRRTLDGKNPEGWVPQQKISVTEALRAYTIDAAFASFEENLKGSLEVGKLADLVVLEDDLLEINPEEIKNVKVAMTILGGEIIYIPEE